MNINNKGETTSVQLGSTPAASNEINANSMQLRISGGATRVQLGTDSQGQRTSQLQDVNGSTFSNGPSSVPLQVRTGSHYRAQIDPTTGEAREPQDLSVRQYSPSQDSSSLPGILGSGRNPFTNLPISSAADIKDDTRFNVNGIEMTAKIAAKAGLLVRDGNGSYSLPGHQGSSSSGQQQDQQGQEQEQLQEEAQVIDHLSSDVRTTLNQIDAHLGSTQATEALVGGVLGHIAGGDWDSAVTAFAQRTGVEPEHAAEVVEGVYMNARHTAAQHVTRTYGINGEQVFDWIDENVRDKGLKASLAHRIYYGDRKAFDEAVNLYKRGNRK